MSGGTQNPKTVETKQLVKITPRKNCAGAEFTVQNVKLKVYAVGTEYAPALAKVIKSEQSDTAVLHIRVPKLFSFKQAHSILHGVFIPQTSVSTMDLYVSSISKFTN